MRPPPIRPKRTIRLATGAQALVGFFRRDAVVHDRHERSRHCSGIVVLHHVAPVDDPGGALQHDRRGAAQDLVVGHAAAASHEHRARARRLHHAGIVLQIVGWIRFDHIRPQLDGLTYERDDLLHVSIDAVAAFAGPHRQRLDHERHRDGVACGPEGGNVADALLVELRLARKEEEIDDDAGRVQNDGALDYCLDNLTEKTAGRRAAVEVRDIGAQNERRLARTRNALQEQGLPGRELNRIGAGLDESGHRSLHVLDPCEKGALAEEAVVDGDIEAASVRGEQAVEPRVHAADSSPARASVSSSPRTPSTAPTAVAARAPAALASAAARSRGQPARWPYRRPAANASPAPVPSIASTAGAATKPPNSSLATKQPSAPSLSATVLTPRSLSQAATDSGSGSREIAEGSAISREPEPESVAAWLRERGVRTVALKLGADGCFVASEEFVGFVAAPAVEAIDGTGAGDAFAAGLL